MASCEFCAAELPEGAYFCGDCGTSVLAAPGSGERTDTAIMSTVSSDAPVTPMSSAPSFATGRQDALPGDAPRFDTNPLTAAQAQTFTLTFSTGESVTVSGTGLLGRNPQPGEFESFDHLIIVTDPDRSVSKTHLEFGVEGINLWVADRFSGNGTLIREIGAPPRKAEPGRRYLVMRGARIDLGEQYFTIT